MKKSDKAMKRVGLLHRLQYFFFLLTIYKSFIRSHLDYGDVIYDQSSIVSISNKIETVPYYPKLAIKKSIRLAYLVKSSTRNWG